ncbi:MAG: hypothetical protein K9H49_05725 [Bacteroidales bacterium]|nr:hypothetical protein [Bacteroidales bacterium]MCF8404393.1 hypothetical protein [Bacteroidales bacterium]
MMNIYNGIAKLDMNGKSVVTLPVYFDALNKDFRYQLTAIGKPGLDLYIEKQIVDNKFIIAGGDPGMEVSWQVTGIRKDPYAEEHRIHPELEKIDENKGKYLHPEL